MITNQSICVHDKDLKHLNALLAMQMGKNNFPLNSLVINFKLILKVNISSFDVTFPCYEDIFSDIRYQ